MKTEEIKKRPGYWVETSPDGKKLLCFRAKHDGKKIVVKLTEEEIKEALN